MKRVAAPAVTHINSNIDRGIFHVEHARIMHGHCAAMVGGMPRFITKIEYADDVVQDDEPVSYQSESQALMQASAAAAQILSDELCSRSSPVSFRVAVERLDGTQVGSVVVQARIELIERT